MGASGRTGLSNASSPACSALRASFSLFFRISPPFDVERGAGIAVRKGGTVNRPRTLVTHRKHSLGDDQGRNFPVHLKFGDSSRPASGFQRSHPIPGNRDNHPAGRAAAE